MAHAGPLKIHNDMGLDKIKIGAKSFQCIGAKAPFDHPHVFLEMGDDDQRICPYCSTLFIHDKTLKADEAVPAEAVYHEEA